MNQVKRCQRIKRLWHFLAVDCAIVFRSCCKYTNARFFYDHSVSELTVNILLTTIVCTGHMMAIFSPAHENVAAQSKRSYSLFVF